MRAGALQFPWTLCCVGAATLLSLAWAMVYMVFQIPLAEELAGRMQQLLPR